MLNTLLPDFITKETPEFPQHIHLKRSSRARRASLRLNPHSNQFDLTIPNWMSLHQAHDFAKTQESWMQDILGKAPAHIPFEHGATLPILGKERTINIAPPTQESSARTQITLQGNALNVQTLIENPAARIERHLKTLAKDHLTALAHQKAAQINKDITSVTLRDPRSRWGSCSQDGKIMLSWRLIFAPTSAMDYVIAHEVAHLTHLNHSKAFWTLCEDLSINFTEGSNWMKQRGNELMRYG